MLASAFGATIPLHGRRRALIDKRAAFARDGIDGVLRDADARTSGTPARGMVTPMHEPGGYPPANDRVIEESAASDGRLVAFCRLRIG